MGAHRSPATVFRKISISIPRGRELNGDRESERETGKRRHFRRPLVLHPTSSPALTLFSPYPFIPARYLPDRVRGRVYFCNLLEDRQLDFQGSFGYRISVRLARSDLDPPVQTARQIHSRGNGRGDHLHLPRIIPLSLTSFLPRRPNESG